MLVVAPLISATVDLFSAVRHCDQQGGGTWLVLIIPTTPSHLELISLPELMRI